MTALLASPLGLLIGLALGALGGGGSVLAVPALVYVVGQTPQAATTTSLVVVALTSLGGLVGHARAGHVRLGAGTAFGVAGLAGSVAGSRLNASLPEQALLAAFAVLLVVAGVAMLRRRADHEPLRPGPSDDPVAASQTRFRANGTTVATRERADTRSTRGTALRVVLAGTAVGFLTGLLGVGGGFAVVPALVLALRFPMPIAVGTSLLVIALNAATALATRLVAGGAVDWAVAVPFTAAGLVGVVLGTRVADRVDPERLTRVFAGLLILVAVVMGVDALA